MSYFTPVEPLAGEKKMSLYYERVELKKRMKRLGLTMKDVANEFALAPGTISAYMGGWTLMPKEMEAKITEFITSKEKKGSAEPR